MIRQIPALTVMLAGLLATSAASAHIALGFPAARYGQDMQKDPPCGAIGNPPGANPPTVFQPGDTITVTWDEFVDHDSHYRISFSAVGDDGFLNPVSFEDFYNSDTVLADDITDEVGVEFHEAQVQLPDIECNPCTLQLMQVMYGGTFSEDSLYYQCADIVIGPAGASTSDGGEGTAGPTTDDSSGGGSSDGGATGASATGASATGASATGASATGADDGAATGTETGASGGEPSEDDSGGCGCRADRAPSGPAAAWALLGVGLLAARRRR